MEGNYKVLVELIKECVGLRLGEFYDYGIKFECEFDLLDVGVFMAVFIRIIADTKFIVSGSAFDIGGVIKSERIDDEGNFILRDLSELIDLKIHVREVFSQ